MTKVYDSYPLVQKALAEQRGAFKSVSGGLPAELEDATLRALDLLQGVNTSDVLRENMMTVSILMNSPPYIALKSKRFASDYNDHVQDMIDTHLKGEGLEYVGADLAQVYSALFVAHGENLLEQLAAQGQIDEHWKADMRDNLEGYLDDRRVYQDKIAPSLLKVEEDLIARTFAVLAPATKPTPKSGGPKP